MDDDPRPMTEQVRRARAEGWQEGHDAFCDFATPGAPCAQHPNPYEAQPD